MEDCIAAMSEVVRRGGFGYIGYTGFTVLFPAGI